MTHERVKPPYMTIVSPGRADQCLRDLRGSAGRVRIRNVCGHYVDSLPARYRWLIDVVEAPMEYYMEVISVRRSHKLRGSNGSNAAWRGRRRCRVILPPELVQLIKLLAKRYGMETGEFVVEAARRGKAMHGTAWLHYWCRDADVCSAMCPNPSRIVYGVLAFLAEELLGGMKPGEARAAEEEGDGRA